MTIQDSPRELLVAGSYNATLSLRMKRLPVAGETVLADELFNDHGGKGANQAIGAARLGASVTFAVVVGADSQGLDAQDLFIREGLMSESVHKSESQRTGQALVLVDESGNNQIVVIRGANDELTTAKVPDRLVTSSTVLLCQLECPPALFVDLATRVRAAGGTTILNPAPVDDLSLDDVELADFLTPNETELCELTGLPVESIDDAEKAARILLEAGCRNVVVTLGEAGALWVHEGGTVHVPARPTQNVDSTGAGDAFNAGFAVAISEGHSVTDAVGWGVACGSFSIKHRGVLDGLATRAQIEEWMGADVQGVG